MFGSHSKYHDSNRFVTALTVVLHFDVLYCEREKAFVRRNAYELVQYSTIRNPFVLLTTCKTCAKPATLVRLEILSTGRCDDKMEMVIAYNNIRF